MDKLITDLSEAVVLFIQCFHLISIISRKEGQNVPSCRVNGPIQLHLFGSHTKETPLGDFVFDFERLRAEFFLHFSCID